MAFDGVPEATASVLLAEPDAVVRDSLAAALRRHGFAVLLAHDDVSAGQVLRDRAVDVLLLDEALPGQGALSLCRRLAEGRSPGIIMVAASAGATDRIVALELGCDDYVDRACDPRELVARVRALLRRVKARLPSEPDGYEFSGWRLCLRRQQVVSPKGKAVPLTPADMSLLLAFLERPGEVLSREDIRASAGGEDTEAGPRLADWRVTRLRKKLGSTRTGAGLIRTVPRRGYMLDSHARAV